jgi:hypothetical protein
VPSCQSPGGIAARAFANNYFNLGLRSFIIQRCSWDFRGIAKNVTSAFLSGVEIKADLQEGRSLYD